MKKSIVIGAAVIAALAIGACKKKTAEEAKPEAPKRLGGVLEAKSGAKLNGNVMLTEDKGVLMLSVQVNNAIPGNHGLHLHEKGDCSAPDAASAGGHYNPKNEKHGGPASSPHHAGDLGNMTVNAEGAGHVEIPVHNFTFAEAAGKSIVLHEKVDDFATDPSGNSGARIGCAVLKPM